MVKSRRVWWGIYGVCSAVVIIAMLWITFVVIQLERAEMLARSEAAYQESIRLALWRMDSWIAPRLAEEASRRGGHVQVGLEPFGGDRQPTNLELVEETVALAERVGRPVATSSEAAAILGIPRR